MPTPVSSHDVSMPSTKGCVVIRARPVVSSLALVPAHYQGVGVARLVVAAAYADGDEPVRVVEALRRAVVDRDLQQHRPDATAAGLGQQGFEEGTAKAFA